LLTLLRKLCLPISL